MLLVNRLATTGRRLPDGLMLAVFAGFVGLANWPLIAHLSTHVQGRPFDDVVGIVWGLDWTQRAIFNLQVSPFFMPDVFYPHGFYVASSSPPIWWFAVLSPVTRLIGPVATYNLASLTAYVAAAFGMYKLVTALGQNRSAGIVAGCVYIAAPILTLRLGGHFDVLFSSLWLPYVAWLSQRSLHETSHRIWLLAGLTLGLSFLGHWQFVFLAPLLPVIIIGLGRAQIGWRQRLARLAVVGLTGLIVAAPFAAITFDARSQMYAASPAFSTVVADGASLSPDRLVVPNPLNSLWRKWSQTVFPMAGESTAVSVGYVALIAAGIGLARRWPQRRTYGVLLGVAVLLAMGLTLHWNAHQVVLTDPPPLIGAVRPLVESVVGADLMPPGDTALVIPLPLAILYRLFPPLSLTRVWARFMIVGMVALGVLAGAGVGWLTTRFGARAVSLTAAMVALIFVEGLTAPYAAFTEVSVNARPIDRWLAGQSNVSLVEYPFNSLTNKLAMYRQSLHGQSIVNGYASIEPSYLAAAAPILGTWPTSAAVDLLRTWHVDYVLVNGTNDPKFLNEVLPGIQSVPTLCLERDDNEPELNRHTYFFRVVANGQECIAGAVVRD